MLWKGSPHGRRGDPLHLGAGDVLEATCDFDSTGVSHGVSAGGTHHDEMCNLYFMMWSELPIFYTCFNSGTSFDRHGAGAAPLGSPASSAFQHPAVQCSCLPLSLSGTLKEFVV